MCVKERVSVCEREMHLLLRATKETFLHHGGSIKEGERGYGGGDWRLRSKEDKREKARGKERTEDGLRGGEG